MRGIDAVESICGVTPVGYRAPWFSITRDSLWAHDTLRELGFRYDSSLYDSPRIPNRIQPIPARPYRLGDDPDALWEVPIAVWRKGRMVLPLGGGAYWRALPSVGALARAREPQPPVDLPGPLLPPVRVRRRRSARRPPAGRESPGALPRDAEAHLEEHPPTPDPRRGFARRPRDSGSFPSARSSTWSPMTPTQRYFDKHARASDRLYARRRTTTFLRGGPQRGRELAASVVAQHPAPDVLDLGCGSGRVAEAVLDAGAASYVGIDFSPPMLALARRRLDGRPAVELLEGDFLDLEPTRTFDVVLALGLFDYLADPTRAAAWMHEHCSSTLLASFTKWDWVKGPPRHVYYRVGHSCPIFDYTEAGAEELLAAAGFAHVELLDRGPRGFFVSASRAS